MLIIFNKLCDNTLMEMELWNMVTRQEYMLPLFLSLDQQVFNNNLQLQFVIPDNWATLDHHLLTYPSKMTPRKMTCLNVGVWIFSLIDVITSASLWDYIGSHQNTLQSCQSGTTLCPLQSFNFFHLWWAPFCKYSSYTQQGSRWQGAMFNWQERI